MGPIAGVRPTQISWTEHGPAVVSERGGTASGVIPRPITSGPCPAGLQTRARTQPTGWRGLRP